MFFVMLNHPAPNIPGCVLCDAETGENMAFFETQEKAREAAKSSYLGDACGYEIFELGRGDS